MRYFEVRCSESSGLAACPDGVYFDFFKSNERLGEPLVLEEGSLTDYLDNENGWALCSDRMYDLVRPYMSDVIGEARPVCVEPKGRGGTAQYWVLLMRPQREYACRESSKWANGDPIMVVLDGGRELPHVFSCRSLINYWIVSGEVRHSMDAAGISGVWFEEVGLGSPA